MKLEEVRPQAVLRGVAPDGGVTVVEQIETWPSEGDARKCP